MSADPESEGDRGGYPFDCVDCGEYQWAVGDTRLDAILNRYQERHGLGEDGEG